MARFYASIRGNSGNTSRQGTPRQLDHLHEVPVRNAQSGITGHIRGWDVGVQVVGRDGEELGDIFDIYVTGGSNDMAPHQLIGHARLDADGKPQFVPVED